jgi:hypothetical protein
MSEIQRYAPWKGSNMYGRDTGAWVRYEDHFAAIKALQESNVLAVQQASEAKDRRISELEAIVAALRPINAPGGKGTK